MHFCYYFKNHYCLGWPEENIWCHHDRMSVAYNENLITTRIIISTINFLMLCIWKCLNKE